MSKSAKASLPTCFCREPKKEAGGSTVTSAFFKCCEAGYIKIQLHLLFHLPISAHPHLKSVKQTPIVVAYERDHRKYIHSLVLTTVQEKNPKHFHCSNSLNWLRFDSELTKSLFPVELPDYLAQHSSRCPGNIKMEGLMYFIPIVVVFTNSILTPNLR